MVRLYLSENDITSKYVHRESVLMFILSSDKDQRKKFAFAQCKRTLVEGHLLLQPNTSCLLTNSNGSFTSTERDLGTDSDSDSEPDGYIALCRTCSHYTDLNSDPRSLFLCGTVLVLTQVRLWQCK